MPKRKHKYPEDHHVMRPEIREKFFALMDPIIVEKLRNLTPSWKLPQWQLWRWDTLDDVPEFNT